MNFQDSGETTQRTAHSQSFNSSSNEKYGGLIQKTLYRRILKDLAGLVSYVNSVTSTYPALHLIITIVRILQIAGPSLGTGYKSFWNTDPKVYRTVSVISIFFFLIPPDNRQIGGYYFLIIYSIIVGAMVLILFGAAIYFKKYASLPDIIPPLISIYISTFGFIFHPIACEMGVSRLSILFFEDTTKQEKIDSIVLVVISLTITLAYFWIYLTTASQTLQFKPSSLMTVASPPTNIAFVSQVITSFTIALGEKGTKLAQMIFLVIPGALYIVSSFIPFYCGGFIKDWQSSLYSSSCLTSGMFCIALGVSILLDVKASFVFLICYMVVFIIMFVIIFTFVKKNRISRLQKLDKFVDDAVSIEQIGNANSYLNIMVTGFSFGHPACISWRVCKLGIERWPTNQWIWFFYAKFISIYPCETQTLAWIFRMLLTNKIHGSAAKTIKEQSLSIARQRESNLSPDLKTKLNSVAKHATSAKHKLRHVWDLAIQSNINDMEFATKKAIREINKSDAEILRILRQFPNNRFVTRQYARFCKEMKGDYAKYNEMIEKTRLLQRGMMVNKDQAHEFGINAFEMLPETSLGARDHSAQGALNGDSNSSQFELDPEDDNNQEVDESVALLEQMNNLIIPSTCGSLAMRVATFVIIFLIPVIAVIVYSGFLIDELTEPLDYMYYFSMARTRIFQLASFSEQYLFEYHKIYVPPIKVAEITAFGGSWKTREQLTFICSQLSLMMQNVIAFRAFESDSEWIHKAKSQVFDSVVHYTYYNGLKENTEVVTVQAAAADLILQARPLISNYTLPNDIINSSTMLNSIINAKATGATFTDSLTYVINYIAEKDQKYRNMINKILIAVFIIAIFVFLIETIIELIWVKSNRLQCYKCLTAIPKNIVSQMTENLRVLKKETDNSSTTTNTEMNKQEDNIMKVFVTGGSGSTENGGDIYILIFSTIVVTGLHILSTYYLCNLLSTLSMGLRTNCPHIDYLQGTYANLIGSMSTLNILVGFNHPETTVFFFNKTYVIKMFQQRMVEAKRYYNLGRFGGLNKNEPPFSGYADGVNYASSKVSCLDKNHIPADFYDATQCYSADEILMMIEPILYSKIIPYKQHDERPLLNNEPIYRDIWSLLIFPVYDVFIYHMSERILGTIKSDLNSVKGGVIPIVVTLLIVAFFMQLISIVSLLRIQMHIRGVLKLLLLCPPRIVFSAHKIMTVLSGDFTSKKGDMANRNADFFKEVVGNLPDLIVIFDSDQKVESCNKALPRILGLDETMIHGRDFKEFISTFKGRWENLILSSNGGYGGNGGSGGSGGSGGGERGCPRFATEQLVYIKGDGTEANLEATSTIINQCVVLIFRDTTQTVRYNALINAEKNKSDILLNSILPPSLVKRVHAGEKNISFAVQSASIVFMDIVSFTPWCGSLPADKVMMTLNLLFKKFDAVSSKYSTMTKIKCIGDCYMAAGGIFAEVNQPAEHAKEVVSFALDSLDSVLELDAELGEKLQIRAGVNTGGPIVAGVLGVGKPTFEILGPAINMAQQMEHHGVPMLVHISRSVYELIYGEAFEIKERGSIEVKNGSVVTYLVSKKDAYK